MVMCIGMLAMHDNPISPLPFPASVVNGLVTNQTVGDKVSVTRGKTMTAKWIFLVAGALPSIVSAQTYQVNYTGQAEAPRSIIGGVHQPISGVINAGDQINANLTFDIGKAQVTSLFDADPTINIYNVPVTYAYTIGSYSSGPVSTNAYLQIWNDYFVSSYSPKVDAWGFGSMYRYITNSESPFLLGSGQVFAGLSLDAFDDTGTLLNNDFAQVIPSYTGFRPSFEASFYDPQNENFALVRGTGIRATITQIGAAVPEPSTWAMMIAGFAFVGASMRRRTRVKFRTV